MSEPPPRLLSKFLCLVKVPHCILCDYRAQVVKNVATPSLEVKKLVYIYLVHYAEKKPDEALLAINSLQKDLSGPDPVVRALALRALTGIRVRVAAPLGVIAVQVCSIVLRRVIVCICVSSSEWKIIFECFLVATCSA
jgi:hypothetical protein